MFNPSTSRRQITALLYVHLLPCSSHLNLTLRQVRVRNICNICNNARVSGTSFETNPSQSGLHADALSDSEIWRYCSSSISSFRVHRSIAFILEGKAIIADPSSHSTRVDHTLHSRKFPPSCVCMRESFTRPCRKVVARDWDLSFVLMGIEAASILVLLLHRWVPNATNHLFNELSSDSLLRFSHTKTHITQECWVSDIACIAVTHDSVRPLVFGSVGVARTHVFCLKSLELLESPQFVGHG